MIIFLRLPIVFAAYQETAVNQANQDVAAANAAIDADPDAQAMVRNAMQADNFGKTGWAHKIFGGVVGTAAAVAGIAGGVATMGIGGLMVAAMSATGPLVAKGISSLLAALTESIWSVGIIYAWYLAIVVYLLRTLIALFLIPVTAVMIPMGRWGQGKLEILFGKILQIFLTPMVMTGLFVIVSLIHSLWQGPISAMMMPLIDYQSSQSSGEILLLLIFHIIIPLALVSGLLGTFLHAPKYISQSIGTQVFHSHSGQEGKRMPVVG